MHRLAAAACASIVEEEVQWSEGRQRQQRMNIPAGRNIDLSKYSHQRSLSYLAMRAAWSCVQLPFFPRMPTRLSGLRVALLRLFGARIGKACLIAGGVRVWIPSNLEMGDYSVLGAGVQVYNLAPISIGSNCVISQDSYLCSATHDYTDPAFPLESRPITVHSGAWIAAKVFVAPGITIGEGAVVGACSVVTRPVPPWMVCAGNPCRPIKPRVLKD
jgi:putative colanic acid biosynthesis acetyltransferase WcaF